MDWGWTVEIHAWLAVLGGMLLGASLYAAGISEGRRAWTAKPLSPGGGDLD